jgi:ribosomal protein S18 acetylase RimI-like enzyme
VIDNNTQLPEFNAAWDPVLESKAQENNYSSMTESSNSSEGIRVEEWRTDASRAAAIDSEIDMLADVLHAVVHGGAGVSFFEPFSIDEARAFWVEKVLPGVRAGTRRVLVVRLGELNGLNGRIVGTVQLELEMPPNQQHRATVAKLLVHPVARRRGIARALMLALEEMARSEKRTLLTLDTVSGSGAEELYRSLGFITAGMIPRYARGALTPELEGATIMYKELTKNDGDEE